MKINRKEVEHTKFCDLKAGEVFDYNNKVTCTTYIKTHFTWSSRVGAVNLQTGEVIYFDDGTLVRPFPNASLTLE